MPSLTTLYRAVVMAAVVTIVYQGWTHFGPSTEQVKSIATQAVELAGRAWNETRSAAGHRTNTVIDPRGAAAQFAVPTPALTAEPKLPPNMPPATGAPPLVSSPPGPTPNTPVQGAADPRIAAPPLPAAPVVVPKNTNRDITPVAESAKGEDARLQTLFSRLEQLGAHDPQLKPWGSSGQLYRFRCSAALVDSPELSRHFESVAAEPVAAVQEVVTAVDAWRTAQRRSKNQLR